MTYQYFIYPSFPFHPFIFLFSHLTIHSSFHLSSIPTIHPSNFSFISVHFSNNLVSNNYFHLRYGANVNAKTIYLTQGTSYDDTPLHLAAWHHHFYCIKRLVQANANLWTKNCLGLTPERFITRDLRLRDWLENVQRQPRSLQLQCSAKVRTLLRPDKTKNALKLPLPTHLLRLVLFEQDVKIL